MYIPFLTILLFSQLANMSPTSKHNVDKNSKIGWFPRSQSKLAARVKHLSMHLYTRIFLTDLAFTVWQIPPTKYTVT